MATKVEQYLESKELDFRLDGNQAVMQCPFCKQGEKFYMNIDNFLYDCKRGECSVKGNERTFKKHFGDTVWESNLEDDVAQVNKPAATRQQEPIPDIEAAHRLLLQNDSVINWLNDEKGFSLETIKLAKLGLGKRRFQKDVISQALMYPYFEKGICVGVKFRSIPPDVKDFRFTSGREPGLYGHDVIKVDMDYLILTEGEGDAIALWNQGELNVVGVPGCDGKKVTWDEQIQKPIKKYIVFDNDEAGQKGALSFATRFGIDKFLNVVIPAYELEEPITDHKGNTRTTIKDITEFFATGHTLAEFNDLLANAKVFDIEGVTSADSAYDKLINLYNETGSFAPKYRFKWDSVNQRAKGMDDGDMIVILAPAKTGKTSICLNQGQFMVEQYGSNPHIDCMEMQDVQLIKKICALTLEKDEDSLTIEDIKQAKAMARSRPNGFIFTRSSPNTLDEYLDFLRRVKRRYDSSVIVVDNFQILVDLTIGRGNSNNRPSYMSMVSKKLKSLANELKVPLILISQPKQLQEGQMVGANDSEGSSTLTKDADLFITLNRNPEIKMKMAQADAMGKLETNQSHSDNMYVEIALSRRSAGGMCTLKIDGARSTIREWNSEEANANTRKTLSNGIAIVDENEVAAI